MTEHRPPDGDPDDTDAGYRDTLEEKAYEDAAKSGHDPDAGDDAPDPDEDELDES